MDLPKNITQIGESDKYCKIYVEDYVISYIKQINQSAINKTVAVALYGNRKEEGGISYLFFYGACKMGTLQKEVRNLSQAQVQEKEKFRKKYFPSQQFLGYRLLNGEMVEGFHICEQGICRYINGYACFYEKNDAMLAYMLDTRKEEVKPEVVDQEKYIQVKQRQEERKTQHQESERNRASSRLAELTGDSYKEEAITGDHQERGSLGSRRIRENRKTKKTLPPSKSAARSMFIMRASVVGIFALLCIAGITTLNGYQSFDDIRGAARQLLNGITEQKIPDANDVVEAMNPNRDTDILMTEDKLTMAIQKENKDFLDSKYEEENEAQQEQLAQSETAQSDVIQETIQSEVAQLEDIQETIQSEEPIQEEHLVQPDQAELPLQLEQPIQAEQPVQETSTPVSYTIQRGDTLIGISFRVYGTDSRVKDICDLNSISNPDNIQYGQKILLP